MASRAKAWRDKVRADEKKAAEEDHLAPVKYHTGRPSEYEPRFSQLIKGHLAEGAPIETFGVTHAGVSKKTVYDWAKKHPEFLNAMEEGRDLCYAFWAKMGRKLAVGKIKHGNAAVWSFTMKNLNGWSDKVDVRDEREEKYKAPPSLTPDNDDEKEEG